MVLSSAGTPDSSGWAGDAVKVLSAMETYKKAKKCLQLYLFLFSNNMLTSKIIIKNIENHSESPECASSCNKFNSSHFLNNEMTYDTVMKRYQCLRSPLYERAEGGQCSVIFRSSAVSLVIISCWLNLTSQCLVWHVFYTSAVRNAVSFHRLPNSHF